jgi:hypothetical protein
MFGIFLIHFRSTPRGVLFFEVILINKNNRACVTSKQIGETKDKQTRRPRAKYGRRTQQYCRHGRNMDVPYGSLYNKNIVFENIQYRSGDPYVDYSLFEYNINL